MSDINLQKSEKIIRTLSGVSDEYILEASLLEKRGRLRGFKRNFLYIIPAAACLGIGLLAYGLFGGTILPRMGSAEQTGSSAEQAVTTEEIAEPELYAKSDADAGGVEAAGTAEAGELGEAGVEGLADAEVKSAEATEESTNSDIAVTEELPALKRLVMINGKIYYDTEEISTVTYRCGTMDGTITSSVEGGRPTEDNQSNFGTGYGWQYGAEEDTIEVCIKDEWHIFKQSEIAEYDILPLK
ncbi:MAG: hypothetical protein IJ608_09545 [Lachnospiraceae bacterium]|nr:hypothetical protein [Lachnospiraceae bacterium]